jgi:hypothetical protein
MKKITITIRDCSMEEMNFFTEAAKRFFYEVNAEFQSVNFNKAGEIIINAYYENDAEDLEITMD